MQQEYVNGGAVFDIPSMGVVPGPGQKTEPATPVRPPAAFFSPRKVETRHGTFSIYDEDELVGLSLATYGEYSESEVVVFRKCLRPGHVAIDVGANIGAFTVPMARLVGPTGQVIAFEASPTNVPLLMSNLAQNGLPQAKVIPMAASDHVGTIKVSRQDALHAYCRPEINDGDFEIGCTTIDSLELPAVQFIKIDVDRHEQQVLRGAEATIKRCRPIIYIENEDQDTSEALIAQLVSYGYRMYWHRPYHFNSGNFRGVKRNIFGVLVSVMMLCVPEEGASDGKPWGVSNLDEVADIRQDDQMFEREIIRYRRVIEREPNDLMSRLLVAHYEQLMQRTYNAATLIETNLRIDPEHKPTLHVRALHDLQMGRWRKGWKGYELRHGQPHLHLIGADRKHDCPRWDGTPTNEPVAIWSEQGYGDTIMFARFMKHVLARAPNAFLEVQPELWELFEHSRGLLGLPQNAIHRLRRQLPPYAFHLPLPSVPAVLDADEDMIRIDRPYLTVDPMLVANWRGEGNHSFAHGRHPMNEARIGLCGVGSITSERPYTRDVPQKMLAPLVKKHGPFFSLEHTGQFESFATTAAAIKALDLVITVDTSIAHLAGALGVPTWLLLSFDPDFRWGLRGETTIWYPGAQLFRQPRFRDWASVIDQVDAELSAR
jgi:FkbM family methyltransferase